MVLVVAVVVVGVIEGADEDTGADHEDEEGRWSEGDDAIDTDDVDSGISSDEVDAGNSGDGVTVKSCDGACGGDDNGGGDDDDDDDDDEDEGV